MVTLELKSSSTSFQKNLKNHWKGKNYFATEKFGVGDGVSIKKGKMQPQISQIFLHASLISNSHILISQPLVGLGGG